MCSRMCCAAGRWSFRASGFRRAPTDRGCIRKADVDLVLKIKHLLFVDGLTLAGARKQLVQEGATAEPAAAESEEMTDADVAAVVDRRTIRGIHEVRDGLATTGSWSCSVARRRLRRARALSSRRRERRKARGSQNR